MDSFAISSKIYQRTMFNKTLVYTGTSYWSSIILTFLMSRVISPWETSITMNVKLYGLYCLMAMATPYHALHAENYVMVSEILESGCKKGYKRVVEVLNETLARHYGICRAVVDPKAGS